MDFKVELFTFGCAKSQNFARLHEIAKISTRKIIPLPKSQNFVLANNSNNKAKQYRNKSVNPKAQYLISLVGQTKIILKTCFLTSTLHFVLSSWGAAFFSFREGIYSISQTHTHTHKHTNTHTHTHTHTRTHTHTHTHTHTNTQVSTLLCIQIREPTQPHIHAPTHTHTHTHTCTCRTYMCL